MKLFSYYIAEIIKNEKLRITLTFNTKLIPKIKIQHLIINIYTA